MNYCGQCWFIKFPNHLRLDTKTGEGVSELRFQEGRVGQLYIMISETTLLDVVGPFLYFVCEDLRLGDLIPVTGNPDAECAVARGWLELFDCACRAGFTVSEDKFMWGRVGAVALVIGCVRFQVCRAFCPGPLKQYPCTFMEC